MDADQLYTCLSATPPLDLLGMRLLEAHPQPDDIPRARLKEAVCEIVDYTGRCAAAARRLSQLTPVPVTTICVLEFGL